MITVIAIICTAVATLEQPVIDKILSTKAEFITNKLIEKIASQHTYVYDDGLNFGIQYQDCRQEVYNDLFGGYPTGEDETRWNKYIAYRTLTVAVFKQQLHQENRLVEIYTNNRETFKTAVLGKKVDVRNGLVKLLEQSSAVFAQIDRPEFRQEIEETLVDNWLRQYHGQCETTLSQNLSPEDTLAKIGKLPPPVKIDTQSDDGGLKKFALRRWKEGGKELTDKYYTVIRLALADAKEASSQVKK